MIDQLPENRSPNSRLQLVQPIRLDWQRVRLLRKTLSRIEASSLCAMGKREKDGERLSDSSTIAANSLGR